MTANELAKQFNDKGLAGEYISRSQGDYLFSLAQKSGQTEVAGQRSATGEFNGKSWKLVFDKGRPLFMVK